MILNYLPWRKEWWVVLLPVIFMIVGGPLSSNCIRLDRDGGYSLLVGVDFDELKPEVDLESILTGIKSEFEDLSRWMHSSTKRFYIKHVDILLQSAHSHLVKSDGLALNESYKLADVQISGRTVKVQVRNSNGCGMPGQSIKVPLERYINDRNESVGNGGKSLLPYFARYRWGVFEESAVESDLQKYPKFYKDDKAHWRHTSCLDNHFPEKASTSLMSHSWVDNVREFCDRETHNRLAPTPQNILCGYRSVMEVIRETEDWKYVEGELGEVVNSAFTPTTFRLLRRSDKPYLYLLLDRQISHGDVQVIDRIGNQVSSMLQYLSSSIVTQIGIFPSMDESNSSSSVEVLESWAPTSKIRNIAPRLISENFATLNFTGRSLKPKGNFASALFELSKSLQHLDHPEGTVVVVLKAGPATNSNSKSSAHTFEHDIIASLKTAGVRLHALELQSSFPSGRKSGINLENLVNKVGGSHLALDPLSFDSNQEDKLRTFVKEIEEEFKNEEEHQGQDTVVVYRGFTNSSSEGNNFHPGGNLNGLQLFLSGGVPFSSIMVNNVGFPIDEGGFEWNLYDDGYGEEHRYVHHSELAKILTDLDDIDNQPINVKFECEEGNHLCEAYMVVTGEVEEGIGWEPLVQISTSSQTNFFDWGVVESSKPFHIYAELLTELVPIYRLDFIGILCGMELGEESCFSFPMIDDGLGEPDILKGDGVHSFGYFPERDGRYYAKVMCTVWGDDEETPVMTRTFDHDSILTFRGTEWSEPTIRKINDLHVVNMDEEQSKEVELEWTAPVTYTGDGKLLSAETYDLRYAPQYSDLIEDFDNCRKPRVERAGLPKPDKPGTKQRVKVVDVEMNEHDNDVFFAMRSTSSGIQSEASNLVSSRYVSAPVEMGSQNMSRVMTLAAEDIMAEATGVTQSTTADTEQTNFDESDYTTQSATEGADASTQEPSTDNPTSPETIPTSDASTQESSTDSTSSETISTTDASTQEPFTDSTSPETIPTTDASTQEPSTDSTSPETIPTTDASTQEPSTDSTSPDTIPTTETSTQEPSSDNPTSLETIPTTEEIKTSTSNASTTPTSISTTSVPSTLSTASPNIPEDEQFFKKPIGYITAGVGGGVVLIGLAGSIGYLYWRRKRLIDSGRLRLHNA